MELNFQHTYNAKLEPDLESTFLNVMDVKLRTCESHLKSSLPHPERSAITKLFCHGNMLSLLIKQKKLIWISVLISV